MDYDRKQVQIPRGIGGLGFDFPNGFRQIGELGGGRLVRDELAVDSWQVAISGQVFGDGFLVHCVVFDMCLPGLVGIAHVCPAVESIHLSEHLDVVMISEDACDIEARIGHLLEELHREGSLEFAVNIPTHDGEEVWVARLGDGEDERGEQKCQGKRESFHVSIAV